MWAMIREGFVVEAKVEVYFMEKEGGYSFSGDGFFHRAENHPLSKPMVDHDQEGIKAGEQWKVSYRVTGDLLKGSESRGVNGNEWGNDGVCIHFALLAGYTAFNVCIYRRRKRDRVIRIQQQPVDGF